MGKAIRTVLWLGSMPYVFLAPDCKVKSYLVKGQKEWDQPVMDWKLQNRESQLCS